MIILKILFLHCSLESEKVKAHSSYACLSYNEINNKLSHAMFYKQVTINADFRSPSLYY